VNIAEKTEAARVSGDASALAGFLLSGFLLAFLGAILPVWDYHRDPADFGGAGNYFLCLAVGIVAAAYLSRPLMRSRGLSFLLVFGCVVSCIALIGLALVPPPLSNWWRNGGCLTLGTGAGLINQGLFYAISTLYREDAASTINIAGIWYGLGCLAATLLVASTVYVYSPLSILIFMAIVPFLFACVYARRSYPTPPESANPSIQQAIQDFRSPGAILFAMLLFFQFGNEWSIAGWLPILLMRRIGLSASSAILVLAAYWVFLLGGRLVAVAILPHVRQRRRLLAGSVLSAIFGCVILFFTNNTFGAINGAFFLGAGFASIYPLVADAIGRRFPYYHPGFFSGVFSVALVGGLLAPATLGYAAAQWGVGVVIGLPLIGSLMVMFLLVLIWLESKVTGR
jgi:fucose permease